MKKLQEYTDKNKTQQLENSLQPFSHSLLPTVIRNSLDD